MAKTTQDPIVWVVFATPQQAFKMNAASEPPQTMQSRVYVHAREEKDSSGVEWTLLNGTQYGFPTAVLEEMSMLPHDDPRLVAILRGVREI